MNELYVFNAQYFGIFSCYIKCVVRNIRKSCGTTFFQAESQPYTAASAAQIKNFGFFVNIRQSRFNKSFGIKTRYQNTLVNIKLPSEKERAVCQVLHRHARATQFDCLRDFITDIGGQNVVPNIGCKF